MKRETTTRRTPERAATTDRGTPAGEVEVRMLTAIAGLRFSYAAGEIGHFPKAEAERLIKAGMAERAA